MSVTTGAFGLDAYTANYDGAAQSVAGNTYGHLMLTGSGTKTLAGDTTVNGNLNVGSGVTFDAGGSTLTLNGDWTNNGAFTPGSSTVVLNKNGTQNFAGTLTLNNLTINATATLNAGSSTLTVNGDWTNNGAFSGDTGTVVFAKSGAQTLTGDTTFNNLTVNSGTLLDVGSDTATVNGALTLNGTMRRTTPTLNATHGNTVSYTDPRGFATADLTSNGATDLGSTNVVVTANSTPGKCGNQSFTDKIVLRAFSLNPENNTDVSATVRLYFAPGELNGLTAGALKIYHCDGAAWQELKTGTYAYGTDATGYNYVELPGVTSFSPFALGPASAPTPVNLVAFDATYAVKKQHVMVKWQTGNELKIVGFNVWRKIAPKNGAGKGEWKLLNAAPIAPKRIGEAAGAAYSFTDKKVKAGKTYRFKLELLTADGSEWSKFVTVKMK